MNKLETLQQKANGIIFIKAYPILNKIENLNNTEKQLIELVLSYQDNKQIFKMSYKRIAELLNIKLQSVKNLVSNLKLKNILITNHKSNFNGVDGGSSTELSVDVDYIISLIEKQSETVESEVISNAADEPKIEDENLVDDYVADEDYHSPFEVIYQEKLNELLIPTTQEVDNTYSSTELTLSNGNVVFLKNSHLVYWDEILAYKKFADKLKTNYSQKSFDDAVEQKISEINLMNKFYNKTSN
jgi:DNA-binding CsgD family transcriptional regulator